MGFWTGILGLLLMTVAILITGGFQPSTTTLIAGVIGGLCFASAGILSIYVLSTGPFIWSVLTMNLSSFLPVLFSIMFLGESISITQIVGVILILSILLIMSLGLKGDNKPFTAKWMIVATVAMFTNGAILCSQKAQSTFMAGAETIEMLAVLFLSGSVFAWLYCIKALKGKEIPPLKQYLPPAFGLIFALGIGNVLGMTLMGRISAAIQFPVLVGGGIVIASTLGVVLYKEKPGPRLYISIALLIAGVTLLGI